MMSFNKEKRNPVLTEALEAEARAEQAQYFTGEREAFSPEFERQMARLSERSRHRTAVLRKPAEWLRRARDWVDELLFGEYRRAGYYGRRGMKLRAVCTLMVAILVLCTGMVPPPASTGQTEWEFHAFNGQRHISFKPQAGYVYPAELETGFTLSHLPEGYTLYKHWAHWTGIDLQTIWINHEGSEIALVQNTLNIYLHLNVAADIPGKPVRVGRYSGRLFVCPEQIVLVWTTDYVFTLEVRDPRITPEEVVALATGLVETGDMEATQ